MIVTFIWTLIIYKKAVNKKANRELMMISFFALYIMIVICLVIFPLPIQKEYISDMIKYKQGVSNNMIPFMAWIDAMGDIDYVGVLSAFYQPIANIALFFPFGFYLPIIIPEFGFKKIIFVSFLFSLTIELTQEVINFILGFNYRSFDVDDLICNTLGALLGYILFKYIAKFVTFLKVREQRDIDAL
ncbi:VanZ family protein [Listeria grandensis]|uniref:VanZ family protein n=1 Tax=Listeria grandensis TaxID=1494963 RepID=UPI001625513B|nr:VanZ family protein [Listeria grandensis]MBC1475824.1 VanZ family protein [Listeria grandensis]